MELQSLKKGKEVRPKVHTEVWCLKCKGNGRDKVHCPIYQNYLIRGGPVPLKPENTTGPSVGVALWCTIFQIFGKHVTDNYHLLQKNFQTSQQLFCVFYKLVGHDERNCQRYELMMERTPTYMMQVENQPQYQSTTTLQGGFQVWGRG